MQRFLWQMNSKMRWTEENKIVFIARLSSDKIWYISLNPHFTSFSFAFITSWV